MASKNSFVGHSLFWLLAVPFALVLAYPAFLVTDAEEVVPGDEIAALVLRGREPDEVNRAANLKFRRWFVDTGAVNASLGYFAPNTHDGAVPLSNEYAGFAAHWIRSLWKITYRAIWRWVAFFDLFVALLAAIALPCFVDGLVQREKKLYTFGHHNPVYFYTAKHGVILMLGLSMTLPWLPLPLSYPLWAAIAAVVGAMSWFVAANFQTGG